MSETIISKGIKNIYLVFLSQLIGVLLSLLTAFILPMHIGIEEFGYWQLYLLYTSYVVLFCFGYNDGLYLRYGKYDFSSLPFKKIRGSFQLFIFLQFIITILLFVLFISIEQSNKTSVYLAISFNVLLITITGSLNSVFQFTNQIALFTFFSIISKLLSLFSVVVLIFIGYKTASPFIIIDIFIKLILLLLILYKCRELVFGNTLGIKAAIVEFKLNVNVGIKLMIANLMGMLIIGLSRIFVDLFSTIKIFAVYSFAISSSSLVLVLLSSLSIVIYPVLSRVSLEKVQNMYTRLTVVINLVGYAFLFLYFPLKWFILNYLKDYKEVLIYLPLLIVIIIIQSKIQLIINTYYKILREEKAMLKANFFSLLLFVLLGLPTFIYTKSVLMLVFTILITFLLRYYFSDWFIRGKIKRSEKALKFLVFDLIIIIIFILSIYLLSGFSSFIIIAVIYIIISRFSLEDLKYFSALIKGNK